MLMLKKALCCYLVCFLVLFNVHGSEFSVKKRLNYIKSELIKLTNDETKTSQDYIDFLDREIQKIDAVESPYDQDFTSDELVEIKDYLLKVKSVFEQKETEENPGILSTIWDWLVSASPYIAFSASVIGALFLGFSFFGDDDEGSETEEPGESSEGGKEDNLPPTPTVSEKKPYFGKTFRELVGCSSHAALDLSNVAWSPDSKFIVYGDAAGYIDICNVRLEQVTVNMDYNKGYEVNKVSWDPSGKYIATISVERDVYIWGASSGKVEGKLDIDDRHVKRIGWSPDKKYFAATDFANNIFIWKISPENPRPTGKYNIKLVVNIDIIKSFSWSPDGKYIVVGGSGPHLEVWNVSNQKRVSKIVGGIEYDSIVSLDWTSNNYIVSGLLGKIEIRKFSVQEEKISKKPFHVLKGHKCFGVKVNVSPNGKNILSSCRVSAPVLKIWDIQTGKLLSSTKESGKIIPESISWRPDSKAIIFRLKQSVFFKLYPLSYK